MKPFFRLVGWLLVLCGLGLAGLAYSAGKHDAPFGIDVFGGAIRTPADGSRWMIACIAAAAVGALLLYLTRRNWRTI